MYRKDYFEYNNCGLSFQFEDLLIEREQLKIKKLNEKIGPSVLEDCFIYIREKMLNLILSCT